MKKILSLVIAIFFMISLSACNTYKYENMGENENGIEFGYSKRNNDSFVGSITYSKNDTTEIVIPNTFNEAPVVALGGYTGLGVPTPFFVTCDSDYLSSEDQPMYVCEDDIIKSYIDENKTVQVENVKFKIKLPDTLEKIENTDLNVVTCTEVLDGQTVIYKVFRPVYYFEISEKNEVFYTKDGKLYYKETNELFSECIYEEYDYGIN